VSARRLPTLDGWCTATVLPPFVKCTLRQGCGAAGAIGAASLELAHQGCATCEKRRPNAVSLVLRLAAKPDTIAALLSLLNIAQCVEHQ